jgi:hypothetical protein
MLSNGNQKRSCAPHVALQWKQVSPELDILAHGEIDNRSIFQALMTSEGTGYFQEKFSVNCGNKACESPPITKITLAVRKLVDDLIRNDTVEEKMTLRSYLA